VTVAARKPTPEARLREARKIAREVISQADEAAHALAHRSTRTRAKYKIRSDALDTVLRALNGERCDG
jgi:hypothetical protein